MSDLMLKYRPQSISEIWGNKDSKALLEVMIRKNSIPKAVILDGEYGTGKTTIARILGKHISTYNFVEIDPTKYSPEQVISQVAQLICYDYDGFVFFFDEAHRMSPKLQEALLKPIEDSCNGMHFIFATTQFGRIDEGLQSRCNCIKLRKPTHAEVEWELKRISEVEGIRILPNALGLVITLSQETPRDCLRNLQLVSNYDGIIDEKIVRRYLQ